MKITGKHMKFEVEHCILKILKQTITMDENVKDLINSALKTF